MKNIIETQKLSFRRNQSYEILLGNEILVTALSKLARMGFERRCVVITNEVVSKWYLQPLLAELRTRGFEAFSIVLPDGEPTKTLETVAGIYPQLQEWNLTRGCPLFALGGGVIGDLGGFVAATYLRGIPFIPIPTTLLAMVDAAVGGKVGVNLSTGKNLVGAFYQPSLVVMELATLKTLPLTQLSYGLVEAVKHGAIADAAYYSFILKNRDSIKAKDPAVLQRLVRRSLHIKKSFVEEDEREKGKRRILNLGHTFGHSLEALGGFRRYHHGEGVGLGMLMALAASRVLGLLDKDYTDSLTGFLLDFNLPVSLQKGYSVQQISQMIIRDKKRSDAAINFVLPIALGKIEITPVPIEDIPGLLLKILPQC